MRWGGEGDSPSIAPLRTPQTVVELTIELPYIPDVTGQTGSKVNLKQVATSIEEMSLVERTWAIKHMLDNVNRQVLEELQKKGVIGGG
ncbi:hypothetical protein KIV64_gp53 [Mycobacterium phage DroogsArmy]|uniref:Uncharacterized protein n=1 Tax=Mycobacterium phage DroogsArmy TaxID=2744011 RepID=A0A6N0A3V1_9CAUD|nr:hypothetical protein KIV64_gp53 [Mycobacterium phage DroogsArmy]QKO02435.1 hypothetical protein SEA_DROOGSARMY_39 [Mycobacterium phage DroogsArmy]